MHIAQAIHDASQQLLQCMRRHLPVVENGANDDAAEDAKLDARLLLAHVLNVSTAYLYTWPERELSCHDETRFFQLVQRRAEGHPIAYITEQREFWSLNLKVSPATLIPRPETELLVEWALAIISQDHSQEHDHEYNKTLGMATQKALRICDLGTGTGAIALALASELPHAQVTGIDCVVEAVSLANENAKRNHIGNVHFMLGHWLTDVAHTKFELIVSNPPYVETNSPYLRQGDVRFEPASALTSGEDGLNDIRTIALQSRDFLTEQGVLLLEHGSGQGQAVRSILIQNGFTNVTTKNDLAGHDRVTMGYKSSL